MASFREAGRRVVMWSAGVGAAIPLLPVVMADSKPAGPADGPCCCTGKIKPSQLPIYDEPEDLFEVQYHMSEKGQLQEGVEVVRKEVCDAVDATREFRDEVDHVYQTGKAHTAGQINYLLDEENVAARAGAMAAGGLLGLMLGARKKGGLFKKLLYMSAGVGVSAAALYPQYTRRYSEDIVNNANVYAAVAYNFVSGVKPQLSESSSPAGQASVVVEPRKKNVVIVESDAKKKGASKEEDSEGSIKQKKIEVDHGQSNPDDADMYTTRS